MHLRFRQSFQLAPYVRLNLSDSGLSWTFGPRGSSVSVGKSGVHLNLGLTGSGLSARIPLLAKTKNQQSQEDMSVHILISEEGTVTYQYPDGSLLSLDVLKRFKSQYRSLLIEKFEECCEVINQSTSNLEKIHLKTPSPSETPSNWRKIFIEPQPVKPLASDFGLMNRVASVFSDQIDGNFESSISAYQKELKDWELRRSSFDHQEKAKQNLTYRALSGEPDAMEVFLNTQLVATEWPFEMDISLEVTADGKDIYIDIHFPSIDKFPVSLAELNNKNITIQFKPMKITQRQRLYAVFLHSVMFRIIGEGFRCLPTLQRVFISSYAPKPYLIIDVEDDHCLCSVSIDRIRWSMIDFGRLDFLNVIDVFNTFDLRREMTKTGTFSSVIPYSK